MALALAVGPAGTLCSWSAGHAETAKDAAPTTTLANRSYRLTASIVDGFVRLRLDDLRSGFCVADGPCLYHAMANSGANSVTVDRLESPSITVLTDSLTIRGKILNLDVEHRFTAPRNREVLEERVVLKNNTKEQIALTDFEAGMQRSVADRNKKVLPEFAADRLRLPFPSGIGRPIQRGDSTTFPFRKSLPTPVPNFA